MDDQVFAIVVFPYAWGAREESSEAAMWFATRLAPKWCPSDDGRRTELGHTYHAGCSKLWSTFLEPGDVAIP
jgi:hypothetical protein